MSITIREELEDRHVLISNEAYSLALASAKENSLELLESLIESEAVPKDVACHLWSNRLGRAYVNPLSTIISNEAIACLPIEIARKGNVMPLYVVEDGLTVAMPDPDDKVLVRRLAAISGKQISPVFCLSKEVRDAIELHHLLALQQNSLRHVVGLLVVLALGDLQHPDAVPGDVQRARLLDQDVIRRGVLLLVFCAERGSLGRSRGVAVSECL